MARASSIAAKTRGPSARTISTARQRSAPRPLAEPLEFPEHPAKGPVLRSHPSLLGKAGNVGGLDPSRSSPYGTHASNPIVVDDTPHSSTPSTSQFKPKFHGSNYWKRRAATPNQMQKSQSAREILQVAIRNSASSDQKPAKEEAPLIQVLKSDKRFHNLIRDLMAFSKTLEGGLQPPSSSTKPPPPKRRKTRHGPIPAGSQHWAVPFPFAEASKPALYDEKWRNDNIRRLLKELVEVMRDAQKAVMKENCFAVKPRPRKRSQSTVSASPQQTNYSQEPLCASADVSMSETPTRARTEVPESQSQPPPIDNVTAWLNSLSDDSLGSNVDLSGVWDIFQDCNLWMEGSEASFPSLDELPCFDEMNDVTAFPATGHTEDSQISSCAPTETGESSSRQELPGPIPDSLIDPILLNQDPFSFVNLDLDMNSVYSSCPGMGTEDLDGTMSPTSSFGILPTPTLSVEAQTPLDSPHGTSPELHVDGEQVMNFMDIDQTLKSYSVFENPPPIGLEPDANSSTISPHALLTIPTASLPVHAHAGPSTSTSTHPINSRKEIALAKARVQREKLVEEIRRVKMQLWETTIEAGVLSNLSRNK